MFPAAQGRQAEELEHSLRHTAPGELEGPVVFRGFGLRVYGEGFSIWV